MYHDYIRWQFVLGPRWLFNLAVTAARALVLLFSIPVMMRTLLAPWHRDVLPYRGGTLTHYAMTFAWNIISRLIGFAIRGTVILIWSLIEAVLAPTAALLIGLFVTAPLLVMIIAATGFVLIITAPFVA